MWINLDIFRSIAVLAVFIAHLMHSVIRLEDGEFDFLEAMGRFGVIIFFVHTSLVLMFSMERTRREPAFAMRFYVRRAFRIYPLAIVAVLIVYFFHVPPGATPGSSFRPIGLPQLVSNVLLIQNVTRHRSVLGPLWSLPLEVQMYALLPALFVMVESQRWRMRLTLTFAGAGLAAALVWHFTGKLNLFAFIPCFLSGVWAFKRANHARILPAWGWPLLVLALLFGLLLSPVYQRHYCRPPGILMEWLAAMTLGFLWPMFREITWKPVAHSGSLIAKYSYGIYLSHTFALYLTFIVWNVPTLPGIILAILLTAILSVLVYHTIEEPLIKAGKKAAARWG